MNKSPQHQSNKFEGLDKSSSNTLKRNPNLELGKTDLVKLTCHLEAELQARDIVIATLKCDRVKHLLLQAKVGGSRPSDPFAALQRDSYAGGSPTDETCLRALYHTQLERLEQLIQQQRRQQQTLLQHLRNAHASNTKAVQELEDEKRKHEHDTAQGDDVTYALEKDRTRIKQELEMEKQAKRKLEKELKKLTESVEAERWKQKQIIMFQLADRNALATKYLEERKRSEDLAQIVAEEKRRVNCMAEGLEEESQRSLRMEAEIEKQSVDFNTERQSLKQAVANQHKRVAELEGDMEKVRLEADNLRKQLAEAHQVAMFQASTTPPRPLPPAKPPSLQGAPPVTPPRTGVTGTLTPPKVGTKASNMRSPSPSPSSEGSVSPPPGTSVGSSVTKTVQPTASVSSVPVSQPATGIARSVGSATGLRSTSTTTATTTPTTTTTAADSVEKSVARLTPNAERSQPQVVQVTPRVTVSASPGTKVFTTTQGGKVTFHVTSSTASQSTRKPAPPARGAPPPVPPNKPALPPKKPEVTPISFEVKPQKAGPQGVKFGITISKDKIHISNPQAAATGSAEGTPQVGEALQQELDDFHQILSSMSTGSTDVNAGGDTVPSPRQPEATSVDKNLSKLESQLLRMTKSRQSDSKENVLQASRTTSNGQLHSTDAQALNLP